MIQTNNHRMTSSTIQKPGRESVLQLKQHAPAVLPSLLLCDFANLEREVRALEEAGVTALHLDVMDGDFVPNFTYGLTIVDALRKITDLPLDAHLMISNPEKYIKQFAQAGADLVTIHIEACPEPAELLEAIRSQGAASGLALNPPTSIDEITPYLSHCDMVLVMSVMPGFGGQAFDDSAIAKLQKLSEIKQPEMLLQIDGGVNEKTIASCTAAGADLLVAGSAIFGHEDYSKQMMLLGKLAMDGLSADAS